MTSAAPSPLPRDVVREKTRDGMRYTLPQRNLGRLRWFGLVPVAIGLAFISFPVSFMAPAFRGALTKPSPFHAVMAVFLLVFVFAAMRPVKYGMLVLFGRCSIVLDRQWLVAIDRAGPFRHVRRARREDVRRFDVKVGRAEAVPAFLQPLANVGGLEAQFDDAKPMSVAIGYPREWLVALGDELSGQISESNAVLARPALPRTAEVVKELSSERLAPLPVDEVLVQPKTSNARLETAAGATTIVLPALGIRRGSKGLFTFSLVWCGFMAVFTTLILIVPGKTSGAGFGFAVFILLFWGIGAATLLGALNMARRRAMLFASPRELRVAHESIFGKKAFAWTRDQLVAIRADQSGMVVNNRPVIELQIHTVSSKKTGLFSGRDDAELQWLATVLRDQLKVPPTAS